MIPFLVVFLTEDGLGEIREKEKKIKELILITVWWAALLTTITCV